MLKLNGIKPGKGARKEAHRVGRGNASGSGCTSGYGMNGSKARSGDVYRPYFEGGQTPLSRRLPKRGFVSPNKVVFQAVNLGQIAKVSEGVKEIDAGWLVSKGLIGTANRPVKVLGTGELKSAITIKADAFSTSAKEKITKVNGKAEEI